MDIYIKIPQKEDLEELRNLFDRTISDAFQQDGIDDPEGIIIEVEKQMDSLHQFVECPDSTKFYLIAHTKDTIIGTIGYSKANSLIQGSLNIDLENIPEVKSVYVLPEYQSKGIGSLLFNAILLCLHHKKITTFCLDGGYKKSQGFWINKLGAPSVTLKNYWGEGLDHMIWLRNLSLKGGVASMESGVQPVLQFVDCVQLFVPDLQKGMEYYCTHLGLKMIWKTDHAVGLGMAEGKTEIVIQNERNWLEVDFKVKSVTEAIETLKDAGGEIVTGPFDIPIGQCAVVKDPWGNQYVILDSTKGTFVTDEQGNIIGQNKLE